MSFTHGALALNSSSDFETNLVSDLSDNEKGYARGPERQLMSALLFDGIQACICYLSGQRNGANAARYKEAYIWVTTRGSEYVFSFESVCESLGVEPEYLRCGLLGAARVAASGGKRRRRTF